MNEMNLNNKELLHCPTPGCTGMGHISGNYATHRSLSGCPHADRAQVLVAQQEIKFCPTPGCDGSGHITGNYTSHRSLSGCPRAVKHRKSIAFNKSFDRNNDSVSNSSLSPISNNSFKVKLDIISENSSQSNDSKSIFVKNIISNPMESENNAELMKSNINKNDGQTCPTPGLKSCDGSGHSTGSFLSHRSLSGCPRVSGVVIDSSNKSIPTKVDELSNAIRKKEPINQLINNNRINDLFNNNANKLMNRSTDDIGLIEEQIRELQEYNTKTETELNSIKNQMNQLQQQLESSEKENQQLFGTNENLNQYYQTLSNKLLSVLETINIEDLIGEEPNQQNFDEFLEKLQQICRESYKDENRHVFSTIRLVLKNFSDQL